MTERQRQQVAYQWAISPEQVRLPSEMTPEQLASLDYEYGRAHRVDDRYVYAIRSDGMTVGRRARLDRIAP